MSYSDVVLADPGLAAYLRYDETAGAYLDSSGHGRDTTVPAGSQLTRGVPGLFDSHAGDDLALRIDKAAGVASNVTLAFLTATWLNALGTSFCVEAWARFDVVPVTNGQYVVLVNRSNHMILRVNNTGAAAHLVGFVYDGVAAGPAVAGAASIVPDELYHLALTYDGATMRVWVNGKLDGSLARVAVPAGGTGMALGGQTTSTVDAAACVQDELALIAGVDHARLVQRARCGLGLERAPSWQADRRFTSNGSAPAGADGTIGYGMFGASFDLADSLRDGVVTRDAHLMDRLRATGFFDEAVA